MILFLEYLKRLIFGGFVKLFTLIIIVIAIILATFFITNAITEGAISTFTTIVTPVAVVAACVAGLVILVVAMIAIPAVATVGFVAITAVNTVAIVATATATDIIVFDLVKLSIITGFFVYLTVSSVKDLDIDKLNISKRRYWIVLAIEFGIIVNSMLLVIL